MSVRSMPTLRDDIYQDFWVVLMKNYWVPQREALYVETPLNGKEYGMNLEILVFKNNNNVILFDCWILDLLVLNNQQPSIIFKS